MKKLRSLSLLLPLFLFCGLCSKSFYTAGGGQARAAEEHRDAEAATTAAATVTDAKPKSADEESWSGLSAKEIRRLWMARRAKLMREAAGQTSNGTAITAAGAARRPTPTTSETPADSYAENDVTPEENEAGATTREARAADAAGGAEDFAPSRYAAGKTDAGFAPEKNFARAEETRPSRRATAEKCAAATTADETGTRRERGPVEADLNKNTGANGGAEGNNVLGTDGSFAFTADGKKPAVGAGSGSGEKDIDSLSSTLRMVGGLLILLGLTGGLLLFFKTRSRHGGKDPNKGRLLEVVERLPLGGRREVLLLRVGAQRVVMAQSQNEVKALAQFSEEALQPRSAEAAGKAVFAGELHERLAEGRPAGLPTRPVGALPAAAGAGAVAGLPGTVRTGLTDLERAGLARVRHGLNTTERQTTGPVISETTAEVPPALQSFPVPAWPNGPAGATSAADLYAPLEPDERRVGGNGAVPAGGGAAERGPLAAAAGGRI